MPACRPYAKDCQYGTPPTLGLLTAGNRKAKGADQPMITEAARDWQDKLTEDRTAPGMGRKESEIKASNDESLRQRRPPGKGAFNGERFKQDKRAEDCGLRPIMHPPPWRVNPDGASKSEMGDNSTRGRKRRYPPQGVVPRIWKVPRAHIIRGESRGKGLGQPPEKRSTGYIPEQEWDQKLLTEKGAREICRTAEASTGRCLVCWNKHVYPRKFPWG